MDVREQNTGKNDEEEKCIAHYWQSANNTVEIQEFTLNTGVKAVALGSEHCLFLGYNGKVFSRGSNNFGQLGLGDYDERKDLTEVQYLSKKYVIDIECGSRHSGVLTKEGHVYCWGDAGSGQCGVGEMITVNEPARLYFIDNLGKDTTSVITKLAFGELHSLGLTDKGQVWAWGSGCALGLGNNLARALTPQLVEDLTGKKVISIACGNYHSLAIIDVEKSTNIRTNKSSPNVATDYQDGPKKRTGFSTRIWVPYRNTKEIERSHSMPITRKANTTSVSINESDCSSSDSDNDGKSSLESATLRGININVQNDSNSAEKHSSSAEKLSSIENSKEESSLSESLDAGISKLTDVFMKSVNGVLSYTTSFTEQTVTDGSVSSEDATTMPKTITPKTLRKQPDVKTQVSNPASVQVWAWGTGRFGQLGHGTTEDRYVISVFKLSW